MHFFPFWHGNEAFPKGSSLNEIVPLLLVFQLPHRKYSGVKTCFYSCRYQNFSLVSHSCHSFSTRAALVSFVWHSCRTFVVLVSLVPQVCCTCIAFVSFVSHSCRLCRALMLWIRLDRIKSLYRMLSHVTYKSSPPEVFLGKDVLKICSKFIGELLCQSVISIKLLRNWTFRIFSEHLFTGTPLEGCFFTC